MLVVFNLIPAFPMDGGRVLRALLAMRMDYARATQIAAALGQGFALVFAFFGLLGILGGMGNPLLLFIALFVWIGASQEAGAAQFRSVLTGSTVRDAMLTSYFTLSPGDPLARAVDLVMAGSQHDFPVVERGRVVGLLTRQRLMAALAEHGKGALVGMAMEAQFPTLGPDELLDEVLAGQASRPTGLTPVILDGQLVGLLTWENVTEYVMIRTALKGARTPPGAVPPVLRTP